MATTGLGYSRLITSDVVGLRSYTSADMEAGLSVRVIKNTQDWLAGQNDDTVKQAEITIGSQVWAARNLDVSHFENADPEKQYQATLNGEKYGKLYNWYAVVDARGLAPDGWHIPSDDEWSRLINYVGYGGLIPHMGRYNLLAGTERQPRSGGLNWRALPVSPVDIVNPMGPIRDLEFLLRGGVQRKTIPTLPGIES